MHTWDVLHGVDVLPGMDRTSLIVWFTTSTAEEDDDSDSGDDTKFVSPWLLDDTSRIETDAVTQFVLASALESVKDIDKDNDNGHQEAASSLSSSYNSQELYLMSAAQQNTFALSRLGSLCETDAWASPNVRAQAQDLLEQLSPLDHLPAPMREAFLHDYIPEHQSMAWRFWFQAARRGNPQAQVALADDLMAHATSLDIDDEQRQQRRQSDEARLLAAVLFGLAAQQGLDDALERLTRVVGMEMTYKQIETQDDFLNSQVVQTAQAATVAMDA